MGLSVGGLEGGGASSYMTPTPIPLATSLNLAIRLEPVSWHPSQAVTRDRSVPPAPPYYATVEETIIYSVFALILSIGTASYSQ